MKKTKIICVYNNKGGVGKTTTSKRLAYYKSKTDEKVLLIDLDPQCNLTSQFKKEKDENIDLARQKEISTSIYDVLLKNENINNVLLETTDPNIDLIPANAYLLRANSELILSSITGANPSAKLGEAIKSLDNHYDYIIIDCPASMEIIVTNALSIADDIIIPLTVDNYSFDGIGLLLDKINEVKNTSNDNLKIAGIFLNRYKRSKIHENMQNSLKEIFKDLVKDVYIGDYSIINENTFTNDEIKLNKHKVIEQYNKLFFELEI